jgi:ABC-type polysaccharide/polyol phosphate export permease
MVNPFYYVVNAARALFVGDFQNIAIPEGFVIISALAIVLFLWGLRSLRKMAT